MTFKILFGRIMLVVSVLLAGWFWRLSRRRREIATHLWWMYLVVGIMIVSSLRDAVPLSGAAMTAAFVIQGLLVLALIGSALRQASRS